MLLLKRMNVKKIAEGDNFDMIKFFVLLAMEILFLIALLFDGKKHREMSKFAKFFFL